LFAGKGVYGFLTGSKGQALRVFEKIFLFPSVPPGERILFKKSLTALNPSPDIALNNNDRRDDDAKI